MIEIGREHLGTRALGTLEFLTWSNLGRGKLIQLVIMHVYIQYCEFRNTLL